MKRLLPFLLLACGVASAGEIGLRWVQVDDPRVTVYRVYYEPESVGGDSPFIEVQSTACTVVVEPPRADGKCTAEAPCCEATVANLADCVNWHLAVKSCSAEECSVGWSPVVKGVPAGQIEDVIFDVETGVHRLRGQNLQAEGPVEVWVDGEATSIVSAACAEVIFEGPAGTSVKLVVTQHDGSRTGSYWQPELTAPSMLERVDAE